MADFLRHYAVGSLVTYKGINEGIENTNYFVDADCGGRYVLTIFEWLDRADLPYFLELMAHTAEAGLPCPHPIADKEGHCLQTLCGKPAALISRLDGHNIQSSNADRCKQVGAMLAAMHEATKNFTRQHPNERGRLWREDYAKKILPRLLDESAELLRDEVERHKNGSLHDLPRGTIHADLFRDNVLFDNDRLSGVIDFYYACDGELTYDLAVTVNDWCSREDGSLDEDYYAALVDAYAEHRPFSAAEKDAWQDTLRRAALRFWLSRSHDALFPRTGHITHVKNADVFKNILLHRRRGVPPLC